MSNGNFWKKKRRFISSSARHLNASIIHVHPLFDYSPAVECDIGHLCRNLSVAQIDFVDRWIWYTETTRHVPYRTRVREVRDDIGGVAFFDKTGNQRPANIHSLSIATASMADDDNRKWANRQTMRREFGGMFNGFCFVFGSYFYVRIFGECDSFSLQWMYTHGFAFYVLEMEIGDIGDIGYIESLVVNHYYWCYLIAEVSISANRWRI